MRAGSSQEGVEPNETRRRSARPLARPKGPGHAPTAQAQHAGKPLTRFGFGFRLDEAGVFLDLCAPP